MGRGSEEIGEIIWMEQGTKQWGGVVRIAEMKVEGYGIGEEMCQDAMEVGGMPCMRGVDLHEEASELLEICGKRLPGLEGVVIASGGGGNEEGKQEEERPADTGERGTRERGREGGVRVGYEKSSDEE